MSSEEEDTWYHPHQAESKDEDPLSSLKDSNPKAYETVKALLKKREASTLKVGSEHSSAAKKFQEAPDENLHSHQVSVHRSNWFGWKPANDDAMVEDMLKTVEKMTGREVQRGLRGDATVEDKPPAKQHASPAVDWDDILGLSKVSHPLARSLHKVQETKLDDSKRALPENRKAARSGSSAKGADLGKATVQISKTSLEEAEEVISRKADSLQDKPLNKAFSSKHNWQHASVTNPYLEVLRKTVVSYKYGNLRV